MVIESFWWVTPNKGIRLISKIHHKYHIQKNHTSRYTHQDYTTSIITLYPTDRTCKKYYESSTPTLCKLPLVLCVCVTCSSPRRPLFLHALSFDCTSKPCVTFLNQFSVYFHIKKMHNII